MINYIQKLTRCIFLILFIALKINAQSLPSVDQITSMSPSQQKELASQYGIDLSSIGVPGVSSSTTPLIPAGLEDLGTEVETEKVIDLETAKKLLQDRDKRHLLRKLERESIPVFERDNLDLKELKTYGHNFFDGEVSNFFAVDNAPIPNNYVIGTGDNISILLYGSMNDEIDLIVDRSGVINFPQLGQLSVAGMTLEQLNTYIEERVRNQMIGVNVNISLGKLRSINVFVTGEAKTPGSYSVSALSSISHTLYAAGGISEIGSLRNIKLIRSNEVVSTFDLYRLLTEGFTDGDIRLQSGDVVFIPPVNKTVIIDGAVKRPGRYELVEKERLGKLLFYAGGLKNKAYQRQALLERFDPEKALLKVSNINLSNKNNLEQRLEDGDIIKVAYVDNDATNAIYLKGAAQRTGQYAYFEGIRFSDIVQSIDSDLELYADLENSLIIRKKNANSRDIQIFKLNILDALSNKQTESDLQLQPRDQILVFSVPRLNSESESEALLLREEILDTKLDVAAENLDTRRGSFAAQEGSLGNNFPLTPGTLNSMSKPMIDLMTDYQFETLIREKEELIEERKKSKGNRTELLSPVIKQLYDQASSDNPPLVVSIDGAIKIPGEYPLMENSTYFDLIDLAGGYTDDALVDKAELRRLRLNNNEFITTQLIDIDLKIKPSNRDTLIDLASRDNIKIRSIKDWDIRDKVTVKGEVSYPGDYLISPNETLSSVISRAGGFTNESFIDGALFTRESIKKKEREQLNFLAETIRRDQASRSMTKESEDFSISSQEIEESIAALLSSEIIGRLIVDLPRIMSGDSSADIVLQDGDIIEIPKYTNAVTVVGEVRRAGSFVRQESFSVDDYIELAAGMTSRGNKKEIYIIRANGSVDKMSNHRERLLTFSSSKDKILAGDTIVVPIKSSYQTPLNAYRTISQVIFQSIASMAAFSSILN